MDFGTLRRLLLLPPRRLLRPPWFPSPWLFWPLLPPRPRPREPRERLRRLVFSPWFLFSELFSELPEFSFFCTAELVADRKSTRLKLQSRGQLVCRLLPDTKTWK